MNASSLTKGNKPLAIAMIISALCGMLFCLSHYHHHLQTASNQSSTIDNSYYQRRISTLTSEPVTSGRNAIVTDDLSPPFRDRTSLENLLDNFSMARAALRQQLEHDYGAQHYSALFETVVNGQGVSRGRTVIQPPTDGSELLNNNSWDRLKSRIMIKLIDVLSNNNEVSFVWATGGHSSAAGHGNFYDESYTAVLEQNVQVIFNAVGMHFKGRNYAMGGSDSAPQAAWCNEEIFGTDVDVLVWDYGYVGDKEWKDECVSKDFQFSLYGITLLTLSFMCRYNMEKRMTDGRDVTKMALYCYRAALNPNQPACIALHAGKPSQKPRTVALSQLEKLGAAVFISIEAELDNVMDAIPDSRGKNDQELAQMPPCVRSFKCGGLIESGDPYCGIEKYNRTMCTERKFMAKWHQGWYVRVRVCLHCAEVVYVKRCSPSFGFCLGNSMLCTAT